MGASGSVQHASGNHTGANSNKVGGSSENETSTNSNYALISPRNHQKIYFNKLVNNMVAYQNSDSGKLLFLIDQTIAEVPEIVEKPGEWFKLPISDLQQRYVNELQFAPTKNMDNTNANEMKKIEKTAAYSDSTAYMKHTDVNTSTKKRFIYYPPIKNTHSDVCNDHANKDSIKSFNSHIDNSTMKSIDTNSSVPEYVTCEFCKKQFSKVANNPNELNHHFSICEKAHILKESFQVINKQIQPVRNIFGPVYVYICVKLMFMYMIII